MARLVNRLTARKIATTSVPGYYADGDGLYLQVSSSGTKSWILRYTRQGKAREMGLGSLAVVSLAEARQAALQQRKVLATGADPIDTRRSLQASTPGVTFGECVSAYLTAHRAGWKSEKHAQQWTNTLANQAASLTPLPVARVSTADVLATLEPIWATKNETATRLRERIGRVLDWAKVKGYRDGDNPARWRGHLDKLLPPVKSVRRETHFAALPFDQVPAFMALIRSRPSITARALEFTVLTAARTSEVLGATWSEIAGDLWSVPADRIKGGRLHEVPLADRPLEILAALKRGRAADVVFSSHKGQMSDNAMLSFLDRLGFGHVTVHGFRSSFRDWAAETTAFPAEVVEMALAHAIRDKAEAAYRRGALLTKRRQLMQAWATHCRPPPAKD